MSNNPTFLNQINYKVLTIDVIKKLIPIVIIMLPYGIIAGYISLNTEPYTYFGLNLFYYYPVLCIIVGNLYPFSIRKILWSLLFGIGSAFIGMFITWNVCGMLGFLNVVPLVTYMMYILPFLSFIFYGLSIGYSRGIGAKDKNIKKWSSVGGSIGGLIGGLMIIFIWWLSNLEPFHITWSGEIIEGVAKYKYNRVMNDTFAYLFSILFFVVPPLILWFCINFFEKYCNTKYDTKNIL